MDRQMAGQRQREKEKDRQRERERKKERKREREKKERVTEIQNKLTHLQNNYLQQQR